MDALDPAFAGMTEWTSWIPAFGMTAWALVDPRLRGDDESGAAR
jgi:hypothetical protein